jgi:purine-binding chemotaxis protein CheW
MADDEEKTEKVGMPELAGKYLTFKLSSEEYGLEILKVREIIGLMNITTIPRTPDYIRGAVNLRGKIIPVVDLRVKFGMEAIEDTEETCIIFVEVEKKDTSTQMGILVDSVSEVLDIDGKNIEPTPAFGETFDARFILAMARIKEQVKILLNIDEVLTSKELVSIISATPQDA